MALIDDIRQKFGLDEGSVDYKPLSVGKGVDKEAKSLGMNYIEKTAKEGLYRSNNKLKGFGNRRRETEEGGLESPDRKLLSLSQLKRIIFGFKAKVNGSEKQKNQLKFEINLSRKKSGLKELAGAALLSKVNALVKQLENDIKDIEQDPKTFMKALNKSYKELLVVPIDTTAMTPDPEKIKQLAKVGITIEDEKTADNFGVSFVPKKTEFK